MKKKILSVLLIATLSMTCLGGCGNSKKDVKDTSGKVSSSSKESKKEEVKTSAIAMKRTTNSEVFPLNGKDIYMEDEGSSWVKIATIWDETLTIYDAASFTKDSKAIAITFKVSDFDLEPTTCYWNYQVLDSQGNEIACWTTDYQTDDLEISKDGTYQMVFDYSKVEGQDVAELQSLQIAFPNTKPDTTTKVTLLDAVCITDEAEMGTVYKTGTVE